jgi:energy-coupling factor transporter ATP-binding protein EcfA2
MADNLHTAVLNQHFQEVEPPYVGLRPFNESESILFFGRDEQILDLLEYLHHQHFIAIIGNSGCGKSSLIRAGLIPKLKAGYLVNDRDRWQIITTKPGDNALGNLIDAIAQNANTIQKKSPSDLVQRLYDEGSVAILNELKETVADDRTNVFILIDQFEELFSNRNKTADEKNNDIEFINTLLELSSQKELPIFVAFTMRSDFIGECAHFYGLPEVMNRSMYLVPRLNRIQLRQSIEGPAKLMGTAIAPNLVSRLLNDANTIEDELPLLQHALLRLWEYDARHNNNQVLELSEYEEIGTIANALNLDADKAFNQLNDQEQQAAKKIFQTITNSDESGRKIRRPAHVNEIAGIADISPEVVIKLVTHFNANKRSFLVVNKGAQPDNPLIDISHESLIRRWISLTHWVDEEAESTKLYRRLTDDTLARDKRERGYLDEIEIRKFENWFKKVQPNNTWAKKHNENFEHNKSFLEKSIKHRKNLKWGKWATYGFIAFGLLAFSFYYYIQNNKLQHSNQQMRTEEYQRVRLECNKILQGGDELRFKYPEIMQELYDSVNVILSTHADNEKLQQYKDSLNAAIKSN